MAKVRPRDKSASPRIVVEMTSSADVRRLEVEDEKTRAQVAALEKRVTALHRTLYEFMEAVGRKSR